MRDQIANSPDVAKISKLFAFSFLFVGGIFTLFRGEILLGAIPTIAAWAYWNMIQDPGYTEKYRYIDWALTTPLMLYVLLAATGSQQIPQLLLANLFMIWTGYKGTQEADQNKKMAWFLLGMVVFVPILLALWHAKGAFYARMLTLALWSLYPAVWSLEESNILSDDTTTVAYSVMDVVAKVGLVELLMRKVD